MFFIKLNINKKFACLFCGHIISVLSQKGVLSVIIIENYKTANLFPPRETVLEQYSLLPLSA